MVTRYGEGGLQNGRGRGKFYPYEKGGGGGVVAMLKGGGHKKFWGSFWKDIGNMIHETHLQRP